MTGDLKSLEKRRRRLSHAVTDFQKLRATVENLGQHAPPGLVSQLPDLQIKIEAAVNDPSEFNVHMATSAASDIQQQFAVAGIRNRAALNKGSKSARVNNHTGRQQKIDWRREWLRDFRRRRPSASISDAARALAREASNRAEELGFEGARRFMQRHCRTK
jgi:hypothetical protein